MNDDILHGGGPVLKSSLFYVQKKLGNIGIDLFAHVQIQNQRSSGTSAESTNTYPQETHS